jgi:hypothetical protein
MFSKTICRSTSIRIVGTGILQNNKRENVGKLYNTTDKWQTKYSFFQRNVSKLEMTTMLCRNRILRFAFHNTNVLWISWSAGIERFNAVLHCSQLIRNKDLAPSIEMIDKFMNYILPPPSHPELPGVASLRQTTDQPQDTWLGKHVED